MSKHAKGMILGLWTFMTILMSPILIAYMLNIILILFLIPFMLPVAWVAADFVYEKFNPDWE